MRVRGVVRFTRKKTSFFSAFTRHLGTRSTSVMDLNGRPNEPLDSPTSGDTSRPKRRKVESEKLRESREMEAAAAQLDREEEEAIDAAREEAPDVSPTQRHGEIVLNAEYRDPQVNFEDDKDDAPYQPPAIDGKDANDELPEDNGDAQNDNIYGEYHSDKPPKHALQGTFLKDLIPMMIGFGDDEAPSLDTVEFIEDALVAYSVDILRSALDLSRQRGRMRSTGSRPGRRRRKISSLLCGRTRGRWQGSRSY